MAKFAGILMALYSGITLPGRPDLENVRRLDLLPIPQIMRMSRVGIAIDLPYLADLSSELGREMVDLQRDIASYIPPDRLDAFSARAAAIEEAEGSATINASSAEQIRVLLFEMLGVGVGRQLKQTAGGKVSTGKKQLDMLRDTHPVIPKVLEYRERSKLKSAFTDSLPKKARMHPRGPSCPVCELDHSAPTWRLHTEFPTTRTETGRLSSKNPNLQQIPVRTELGARIRAAFIASPGTRLVSTDFSQMELRNLAHLSNCQTMIEVYQANGDIHTATAMQTFKIDDPAKVDKVKHRMPSKRTNFGIQNGITKVGLVAQLVGDYAAAGLAIPDWLNEDWCEQYIHDWMDAYPEVPDYLNLQHYRARRYGFVWDSFGRIRRIPEVRSCHPYIRSAGLRQAQNMAITADNAAQTKLAMAELEDVLADLRVNHPFYVEALLSIHDQIITEVDENYAETVGGIQAEIMSNVMVDKQTGENLWRVPVTSDCEITERWQKQ